MFKIPSAKRGLFSALEIGPGFVKFAQSKDLTKPRTIARIIVKKLTSQSQEDIVAALKDIVEEVKSDIGDLTLVIPRHKVTVRFLSFPSVNQKEIEGMVKLQSTKELPFPKEEIISDYFVTEQTKEGYTKVALVIAHQDIIREYLDILKKADLVPQRITFSSEASLNWYRLAFAQERPRGSLLLVDLDSDNTDIVIFSNSHLDFTRGLTFGIDQLQKYSGLREKLVQEIERTMVGYSRQEKTSRIEKIVLGQPGEAGNELRAFLEQRFNLPCQTLSSPLSNLTCEKDVSIFEHKSEVSFLRVLGTVLEAKAKWLNLTPTLLREKQKVLSERKRLWQLTLLFASIFLLSLAILGKQMHNKRLRIFYLDREIRRTTPLARDAEDMLKKIDLVAARRKGAGLNIALLRELHLIAPLDISLSIFDYDQPDKKTTLQGVSTDRAEVFKFIDILEKSIYFKNVQLKYASEKKSREGGYVDFKIECALE